MEKKYTRGFLIIATGVVLIVLANGFWFWGRQHALETRTNANPETDVIYQLQRNNFSYKAEEGKSALQLLQEKIRVVQDNSGLVISINGRKADMTKHEYWAFYINGKIAQVGPAEYMTKTGDKIEWKIERY